MPRSLLSSEPGIESPPRVRIGSSTVTVVELIVVVVPLTVRFAETVKSPVISTPAESIFIVSTLSISK